MQTPSCQSGGKVQADAAASTYLVSVVSNHQDAAASQHTLTFNSTSIIAPAAATTPNPGSRANTGEEAALYCPAVSAVAAAM